MSRNDRQLLQRLGSARDFLSQQVEHKPLYENLICTLDRLANRLQNDSKPLIKIVSPSSSLAENLRAKHEANAELRSLYEFESISPIGQIFPILEDCDLMCLVYEPRREIREHHYNLIRLAKKQDIDLLILVQSQPDIDEADYSRWQRDLDAIAERMLPIACNYFIDFSDTAELELCQRSLIDLATAIASNRQARIASEIIREVKRFFTLETASLWQTVKQINSQYFQDRPLYIFQQQLRQDTQTLNQFRQQLIRDIKQAVNHEKTDLLNPFAVEGLIFSFQQLINSAEVKIVAERDNTYLYLVLAQFPQQPLLHDYILELCQQRVDRILAQQWSNINSVYGGGLELLVERSNRELSKIESLLDYEPKLTPLSQLEQPSLKIDRVIDPYCLKINSRIPLTIALLRVAGFACLSQP